MRINKVSMLRAAGVLIASGGILGMSAGLATACPANPPTDFTDFIEKEIPTGPVGGSAEAEIRINGLVAIGSSAGDSCAAAVTLPRGVSILSVEVVDSDSGKPVGFEGFQPDPRATRGFCGGRSGRCVAFVSKVGNDGIKDGVRMTMKITILADRLASPGDTAQLAARLTREAVISAGGVDERGLPHHHLSVFTPPPMRVELLDRTY